MPSAGREAFVRFRKASRYRLAELPLARRVREVTEHETAVPLTTGRLREGVDRLLQLGDLLPRSDARKRQVRAVERFVLRSPPDGAVESGRGFRIPVREKQRAS